MQFSVLRHLQCGVVSAICACGLWACGGAQQNTDDDPYLNKVSSGNGEAATGKTQTAELGDQKLYVSLSLEDAKQILVNAGYRVESADKNALSLVINDINTKITAYNGGRILAMTASFKANSPKGQEKRIQDWNEDQLLFKSYEDSKGNPYLEMDILVDGGVAPKHLTAAVDLWRDALLDWVSKVVQ